MVCDRASVVVYMNPSAIARYGRDLTGKSVKCCHPAAANERIDRVLAWFGKAERTISFLLTIMTGKIRTSIWLPFGMGTADSLGTMKSTNFAAKKKGRRIMRVPTGAFERFWPCGLEKFVRI